MKIGETNYVQQLQLHNEKALLYVIDKYGSLLMAVIRKHLFSIPQWQEECFNDVLLNIWQHISCFDESKNTFKNWAAAIAKYRAIDYLRQYQKELVTVDIDNTVIAQEDSMLAEMIEREISEEVDKMLKYLKPEDRQLFLKLYVEEKTVEQVSQETGMKRETIYNRLSRGKKKLRKEISLERGV